MDKKPLLTDFYLMEFSTLIIGPGHFRYETCWVIFFIFIQISIAPSVGKQWRLEPFSVACGSVLHCCLRPTKRTLDLYGVKNIIYRYRCTFCI